MLPPAMTLPISMPPPPEILSLKPGQLIDQLLISDGPPGIDCCVPPCIDRPPGLRPMGPALQEPPAEPTAILPQASEPPQTPIRKAAVFLPASMETESGPVEISHRSGEEVSGSGCLAVGSEEIVGGRDETQRDESPEETPEAKKERILGLTRSDAPQGKHSVYPVDKYCY